MRYSSLVTAAVLVSGSAVSAWAADAPISARVLLDNFTPVPASAPMSMAAFSPVLSSIYGLGLEGRAGLMLSESVAAGLVATWFDGDRQVVVNLGVEPIDSVMVLGTVALHAQKTSPDLAGSPWGASLETGIQIRRDDRGHFLGGFELNAWATRSIGEAPVPEFSGLGGALILHPLPGLTARIGLDHGSPAPGGAGSEDSWSRSLTLEQALGDGAILNGGLRFGANETRFSAGLTLPLPGQQNQSLGLEYSSWQTAGATEADQRFMLTWRGVLGGGDTAPVPALAYAATAPASLPAPVAPKPLLPAVMEKPDYLPVSVSGGDSNPCSPITNDISDFVIETAGRYYPGDRIDNSNEVLGLNAPHEIYRRNDDLSFVKLNVGTVDFTSGTEQIVPGLWAAGETRHIAVAFEGDAGCRIVFWDLPI